MVARRSRTGFMGKGLAKPSWGLLWRAGARMTSWTGHGGAARGLWTLGDLLCRKRVHEDKLDRAGGAAQGIVIP